MGQDRLLIYDLLRILGVAFIVLAHTLFITKNFLEINIAHIYVVDEGSFGVTLMLLVSGAVLMYTYRDRTFQSLHDVVRFYLRRIGRLYPAYWMVFVLALLVAPVKIQQVSSSTDLAWQLSGFNAFIGHWGGPVLTVGWFIGVIMVFYLLFPFLKFALEKHPYLTIIAAFGIWIVSRAFFSFIAPGLFGISDYLRWFPPCLILDFILGMVLVYCTIGTQLTYRNRALAIISELSFYVFLVHWALLPVGAEYPWAYPLLVMVLSAAIMACDMIIQKKLDSLQRYILLHYRAEKST